MKQLDPHLNHARPLSCAIYGMGKAGRSLFLSFIKNQIPVTAFFVRHPKSLENFSQHIDSNSIPIYSTTTLFCEHLEKTKTQILFLAVPDDAIENVAHLLRHQLFFPPLIAHLSGALSFGVLHPLFEKSSLAQFHPLASLNGQNPIPFGTLNAICTNEPTAEASLTHLSHLIQLTPSPIKNGMQPLYHIAASMTGNLPLALIADSILLMKMAGIDENLARIGLAKLLRSTAEAVEKKPLKNALTGPITRGDTGTVEQHLSTLKDLNQKKQLELIYRLLSTKLIELNEDAEKRKQFQKLLSEGN